MTDAGARPSPVRFAQAEAPVAERRPAIRTRHGITDPDDLGWMRDHDDPALLPLLEAEDAHARTVTAPLGGLVDAVEAEIRARVQEDDLSVPHRKGGWWYQTRTVVGASYPIHERRPDRGDGTGPVDDEPTVILDENVLAEGHDHLSLGAAEVSPDGRLLAYSVDTDGSESHTLRVRDLDTGTDLDVTVPNVSYGVAWAADSASIVYTTLDPARRPWRVHVHHLGADPSGGDDTLVLEEPDERFWVGIAPSRSGDLIVIDVGSATTGEIHLIDAHAVAGGARLAIARRQGVEVQVAHHGDWLYIVSNDEAVDFGLWRAPVGAPDRDRWQPILTHDPGTRIVGVETFATHLVVHLRHDGRPGIRVIAIAALDTTDGAPSPAAIADASRDLVFPDGGHSLAGAANEEWAATSYRFAYQSLTVPGTLYEEDVVTGERVELKRMPVLGDFEPDDYTSSSTWATAEDGTRIPVSIARRADVALDGTAPIVVYGYGAYEISMDPWFSIARLSLLDRGVVFAIGHVRGGGEMGRSWYEDGRLANKPNSFSDLVAVADHLAAVGIGDGDRIAIRGGSAGGLLVGAALNLAPERFRAVVAEVPFVDALNTILDPDAPLTATEWEEWGDPITDEAAFALMRSYSPTENIGTGPHPAVLATGGLNDPRVGVHEPAIWVQRLRELTDPVPDRPVLLRVDLDAGHGGPSGRYDSWRREAETLAFLLAALDVSP